MYTGVQLGVAVAGTSTAPTGFFVGVASNASTGVMLAQSGNLNSNAALTTTGVQSFAFSAAWTAPTTGLVEIIVLQNGAFAGTNVTFLRNGVGSVLCYKVGTSFVSATAGTASTTLPANASALAGAYSTTGALPIWAALY